MNTFFIGFIDFMLTGKDLLDYTYSSSPNKYEKKINTKTFRITNKIKMKRIEIILWKNKYSNIEKFFYLK